MPPHSSCSAPITPQSADCNPMIRVIPILRGFFFSSRRRHTRWTGDWSSDVCSSDLVKAAAGKLVIREVDSDEPVLAGLEISGPDMEPLTLFINRDNGLIDRSRYQAAEEIGRASCRERVERPEGADSVAK